MLVAKFVSQVLLCGELRISFSGEGEKGNPFVHGMCTTLSTLYCLLLLYHPQKSFGRGIFWFLALYLTLL